MEIKNINYLYHCGVSPLTNSQSSVSFKGKDNYDHLTTSDSVKNSIDVTRKFLPLPAEEITVSKLQEALNLPVKSMSEYQKLNNLNVSSPFAVLRYSTNVNGEYSKFLIFLPDDIANDKLGNSAFLASLAHEYTHYLQLQKSESPQKQFFDELKMAGLNIPEIMPDILKGADEAFRSEINLLKQGTTADLIGANSSKSMGKNNAILADIVVNEDIIAKSIGYDSAEEFIKYFKQDFPSFNEIAQKTINSNPYLKQMYNMYPSVMLDAMKNLLVTYCRCHAKQEAEAYFTENKMFYTQGYDERGSEISYKYYNLIAKALS